MVMGFRNQLQHPVHKVFCMVSHLRRDGRALMVRVTCTRIHQDFSEIFLSYNGLMYGLLLFVVVTVDDSMNNQLPSQSFH